MRKLKLQIQLSVDGFIADINGNTNWAIWNWSEHWTWDSQLQNYFNGLKENVDCVLLSRKMAEEGFITHWKNVAQASGTQSYFAKKITEAHKVVFSKKLQSRWDNTSIASGSLVDEVQNLKNQDGKDMIVYGGASFVSSLIQLQVIDEFYLFINPVILGNGMPIFQEVHYAQKLKLKEANAFPCGMVVMRYTL